MEQGTTLADAVREELKQRPFDPATVDLCAMHGVARFRRGPVVLVWLHFNETDVGQLSGVWWLEVANTRRDKALEMLGYLCLTGSKQRATMQWPLSRTGEGQDVVVQEGCDGSCMDR